ncbi:MAG: 2-phospho-L-lactate transferase [Acetobacteraceae bacterium]|nr:2-phospho-L-lactate transferase [Acetobacteraceae bacterium]
MTQERPTLPSDGRVVALCGGVGGAKLAFGLSRVRGEKLAVIVNTGDDFEHLGLVISPDIDTVLYTLGGRADKERGWGRAEESWNFMAALAELGGETWFQLGDRDLALHVRRTQELRAGRSLTAVVAEVARRFGIRAAILPVSDDPIRTIVETPEGVLAFQRYFVERRCVPQVLSIRFEGASQARASAQVREALAAPGLRAVVICPSNPYLSIDPILVVPSVRELVERAQAPVVAVSPIIGGAAVKGPTAKIMRELGVPATSEAIARHYRGLIDGLIIDEADATERDLRGIAVKITRTLMQTDADRERLARDVLAFTDELACQTKAPS